MRDYLNFSVQIHLFFEIYHKRKFIASFYTNSPSNVLNDKKSVCFPSIPKLPKFVFVVSSFQFSRSSTKRKNYCCAIVGYFDSFSFIDCVT